MKRNFPCELPLVHTKKIRHISWSLDGEMLATCGDDKLVCVWDADRKVLRQSLSGHGSRVSYGSWNAENQLVTCSRDHSLIVWDLLSGKPGHRFQFSSPLSCVKWHGSEHLIVGDESGDLFFGKTGNDLRFDKIHEANSQVISIGQAELGSPIYVAHGNGAITVLSESMEVRHEVQVGKIRGFAIGSQLAAVCDDSPNIVCHSLPDFMPVLTLRTKANVNHSVAFDSESEQLVAYGSDQVISRWWLANPGVADQFPASRTYSRINGVAFHPQFPRLAVVGKSQKGISILNLESDPGRAEGTLFKQAAITESNHCDILVVTANPAATTPLQLQREAQKIESCFGGSIGGRKIAVVARHSATVNNLRYSLHDLNPSVVHFAGHGDETGSLVFQSDNGERHLVDPVALSGLLREFSSIELVMLNACYSAQAAELIAEHVDCVVGMGSEIDDEAAMQFALAFYESLSFGNGFNKAFRLGCNAIKLYQLPYAEQPMAFFPDMRFDSAVRRQAVSTLGTHSSTIGAGTSTTRSEESAKAQHEPVSVKLWFGTIRKLTETRLSPGFGNSRDDTISYGTCEVVVPKRRKVGSLGSGFWRRLMSWNDDRVKFDDQSIILMSPADYWRSLSQSIESLVSDENHALVFIHGYNVSFTDAARRTAQIAVDLPLPGPAAFFAWPSKAHLFGYLADEATIKYAASHLARFLSDFVTMSGAQKIHVIAHSMGNRGLLDSIETVIQEVNRSQPFDQIFLAAPDVDADVFGQQSAVYERAARQTTLYVSRRDKAVWLSRLIHDEHRVGYYTAEEPPKIFPAIDTIRVKGDFDLFDLGHGYVGSEDSVLSLSLIHI